MDRREYLQSAGATAAILTAAGCVGGGGSDETETADGADSSMEGTDSPTATPESVVIGSDIPYRPFEYETTDGDLVGFDVAVADAVFGDQLGLRPEFQDTSFDGIIGSLNNGNFRAIMSAMTITDERDQEVDFSDPYFTAYQTILVLEDSDIDERSDLEGRTVGVQKGTTGAGAADALKAEFDGDMTIKRYDQIPAAFSALQNNQVVAVINDNTVNAEFLDNNDGVRFVEGDGEAASGDGEAPPYLTLTVEEYGIAFREDDDEFRQGVNEALAAIKDDGTYDEIYSEYFSG